MEVERFAPYIGTIGVVILGASFIAFSGTIAISPSSELTMTSAPSTLSVVPGLALPSVSLPSVTPEAESVSHPPARPASPQKKTTPPTENKAPATIVGASSAPVPPTQVPVSGSGDVALDSSAIALRQSLVNIICYAPADSGLRSITGSGVIIDPKGIILTNAHIAQYFLLTHKGISCTIRSGSPAIDKYKASLMYISPTWVYANADLLTKTDPLGTGQYDFAFLAVTGSVSGDLPNAFPSVALAAQPPEIGTRVAIASYGAQNLGFNQIQSSLYPTVVFSAVKDVFTFAVDSVDVLEFGGSIAAQQGSSGGGAVNSRGDLLATLTTSTISGDTNTRTLNAITTSYIRDEYANETGKTLGSLFIGSPAVTAFNFAPQIPALESVIAAHLP